MKQTPPHEVNIGSTIDSAKSYVEGALEELDRVAIAFADATMPDGERALDRACNYETGTRALLEARTCARLAIADLVDLAAAREAAANGGAS